MHRVVVLKAQAALRLARGVRTLDEAQTKIGAYIDRYHHRPHSRLAYRTPREVAATWKDHDDQSIPAA